MKQRIITGALLGLLMLFVFYFSGTGLYVAFATLLSLIGVWEMLTCIGEIRTFALSLPTLFCAVLCPLLTYFIGMNACYVTLLMLLMYLLSTPVFFADKISSKDSFAAFTPCAYVILCFCAMLSLRYIEGADGKNVGQYIYLLPFIAAWITDTFAYFTGVFFGKHKLIPKVSPKKTVEGSIGGIVFCIISFLIYGVIIQKVSGFALRFAGLALLGLILSVISQIGDLIASAIKRNYKIKDYGKLFPGHGGVLDRFDSIMILCPFLLMLLSLIV